MTGAAPCGAEPGEGLLGMGAAPAPGMGGLFLWTQELLWRSVCPAALHPWGTGSEDLLRARHWEELGQYCPCARQLEMGQG